ncbi:MAG: fumarylacetoacetase [Acidimicrobiia bacterium]
MSLDATVDPGLTGWVTVPPGSDFPIQNLPYGVFCKEGERPRVGVAIGDQVLDLAAVAEAGLLSGLGLLDGVFDADALNGFLALGRSTWQATRRRVSELLSTGNTELGNDAALRDRALIPQWEVELLLPFRVGDYVDFYSSLEHAINMGRMLRPGGEPLSPNWRFLPVGYHGRAGSVVVSGMPVVRPSGQVQTGEEPPKHAPSGMLDIELEVGFVTGPGNAPGSRIPASQARDHIFGLVLVNDWSARDIQRWEYVPLGPFLGKSFATSVSPWVVTLDALAPYLVPGPEQDPSPLAYLSTDEDWAVDLELEVALLSGNMEEQGFDPDVISRTSFRGMYWTMAQQLAHATVNGTAVRPGDLYASGTVSGPDPGTYGSLIELTWSGTQPIRLSDGSRRTFLEDGDTVIMRGWCGGDGMPRIGFGEVRGTVLPASQE